jgi:uncharacterized protein (DUF302 family)
MSKMDYKIKIKLEYDYDTAINKVKEELIKEGFGVLTEIDVKSTLKNKLNVDFNKYIIFGVCNPNLAYKALQHELDVGLFLPCNILIYEVENETYISIINPISAISITNNDELLKVAKEAQKKLNNIIINLKNEK